MRRLFKGIKSLVLILEAVGALLAAISFILYKVGHIKNMSKKTKASTDIPTDTPTPGSTK
jgi:hypothetical protein